VKTYFKKSYVNFSSRKVLARNSPHPVVMYLPQFNVYLIPAQLFYPHHVKTLANLNNKPNAKAKNGTEEKKVAKPEIKVPLFQNIGPTTVQFPRPFREGFVPDFLSKEPVREVKPGSEEATVKQVKEIVESSMEEEGREEERSEDWIEELVKGKEEGPALEVTGGDKPTRLVLKPVAKAVAGAKGVAIASPVARAVLRRGQPVTIDFDPDSVAIAGPGGRAHSHPTLVVSYADDDKEK
jgi:hypothetical protein